MKIVTSILNISGDEHIETIIASQLEEKDPENIDEIISENLIIQEEIIKKD